MREGERRGRECKCERECVCVCERERERKDQSLMPESISVQIWSNFWPEFLKVVKFASFLNVNFNAAAPLCKCPNFD